MKHLIILVVHLSGVHLPSHPDDPALQLVGCLLVIGRLVQNLLNMFHVLIIHYSNAASYGTERCSEGYVESSCVL